EAAAALFGILAAGLISASSILSSSLFADDAIDPHLALPVLAANASSGPLLLLAAPVLPEVFPLAPVLPPEARLPFCFELPFLALLPVGPFAFLSSAGAVTSATADSSAP